MNGHKVQNCRPMITFKTKHGLVNRAFLYTNNSNIKTYSVQNLEWCNNFPGVCLMTQDDSLRTSTKQLATPWPALSAALHMQMQTLHALHSLVSVLLIHT